MTDLNDDIARYLSGRMSPAERHALEKKALDDPFLADALDGGESIPEAGFFGDVSHLKEMIAERTQGRSTGALLVGGSAGRGKQVSMWSWPTRIAAGLLFVASAGVVLFFISDKRSDDLALNTTSKTVTPSSPSTLAPPSDSAVLDQVQASTDAAGDADAALKQPAENGATQGEKLSPVQAPAPSAEATKRREQIATTPSGKGAVSPETKTSQEASDISSDGLTKEEAEQALAGRVAGVQSNSVKPDAVKSAKAPTPVASEAEVATADRRENAEKDSRSAADESRSRTEVAAAQPEADAKKTYQAKNDRASQASKKERFSNTQPPKAIVAGDKNETTQVFSGKVVDSDGAGIPGVNIVIKGTNTGTVTDIHGDYQLSAPDSKPTLVYTFIGYASLEEAADPSAPATVALEEDLTQLSEVVVAGYGAQRTDDTVTPTFDFANPAGGKHAFKKYLERNLQYPREALLNQVEGRVTIQFSVETTGSLSDFRLLKGIGSGCDEEVIRLVKSGPKWSPTKRDDVAEKSTIKVRMRFQLPKEKKK